MRRHLHIKSKWGETENAAIIQIRTVIATYYLVAIVEHDIQLNRSTFDVLCSLNILHFDIKELHQRAEPEYVITENNHVQLSLIL